MDLSQAARYVEQIELLDKLLIVTDMGNRKLFTLEKDGKFAGVIGGEFYSGDKLDAMLYDDPAGIGPENYVVRTNPDNKKVFHAIQIRDREPTGPLLEFVGKKYELLVFEQGDWLAHVDGIYQKAVKPEEVLIDYAHLILMADV